MHKVSTYLGCQVGGINSAVLAAVKVLNVQYGGMHCLPQVLHVLLLQVSNMKPTETPDHSTTQCNLTLQHNPLLNGTHVHQLATQQNNAQRAILSS